MHELTYKFNNELSKIDIQKKEFFEPSRIKYFLKEGDSVYVSDGQYVKKNQLLVKKLNGSKCFSTVSGNVVIKGNSVIVTKDGNEVEIDLEEPRINLDGITKEDILAVCTKYGINIENKLLLKELQDNKKILYVNVIDAEPYLFNNKFLLHDNIKNTLDIITLLAHNFNLIPYLIVSKYDKENVFQINSLLVNYPNLRVITINQGYPLNTDHFILNKHFKEYNKEEILFLDLVTINKLFVGLKERMPVSERFVTVVFDNPLRCFVVKTYYGVNLEEMIDSFVPASWGGKAVYLNNFFRKNKCRNFEDLSVTDNVNTIFILDDVIELQTKCIKCGRCADVCPVKINPIDKKLDSSCIKCGLCSYVCPANINLLVRVKENE